MTNYETVSVDLSPDYIKGIEYMCQKMNISKEILLKKCVEQLIFGGCYLPSNYDLDELLEDIDEMGLKPDISIDEEIKQRCKNHE